MNDAQKVLNNTEKTLNRGIIRWITKLFIPKQRHSQTNNMFNTASKYSNGANNIAETGLSAKATVISVQDTGMLVNYYPVVKFALKVRPMYGAGFDTKGECVVSKIAVPKVGDEINIKYNPSNQSEFTVVNNWAIEEQK